MILRKPYAFLIKNFQKINLLLLIFSIIILSINLSFLEMVRNYIAIGFYNPITNPMSAYLSPMFFLGIFGIFIVSSILSYLLLYKEKPAFIYILLIIEYLVILIAFLFSKSYFDNIGFDIILIAKALLVKDILFIVSLIQYPVVLFLIIRSLGFDLKKFGFKEDKEFAEITEEDNEEFIFDLELDTNGVKRKTSFVSRNIKYFVIENKFRLSIVFIIFICLISPSLYNYIFVENKVYKMNEVFVANNFAFKITNAFFTDKNYSGKIINDDGTKFVVLTVDVKNLNSKETVFDYEKFILTADNKSYLPVKTYDESFSDMGESYKGQLLKKDTLNKFILVYPINSNDLGSSYNFLYQEVKSNKKSKLRQINISINDVVNTSKSVVNKINEDITIKYIKSSVNFKITNYYLNNTFSYLYTSCMGTNCRVLEDYLTSPINKTLIKFDVTSNIEQFDLGKLFSAGYYLNYKVDGVYKKSSLLLPTTKKWKNNSIYLLVDKEIEKATDISLELISRNIIYKYKLKGE